MVFGLLFAFQPQNWVNLAVVACDKGKKIASYRKMVLGAFYKPFFLKIVIFFGERGGNFFFKFFEKAQKNICVNKEFMPTHFSFLIDTLEDQFLFSIFPHTSNCSFLGILK
jgi:hypothetical protein